MGANSCSQGPTSAGKSENRREEGGLQQWINAHLERHVRQSHMGVIFWCPHILIRKSVLQIKANIGYSEICIEIIHQNVKSK